jgi:hypothetical protein
MVEVHSPSEESTMATPRTDVDISTTDDQGTAQKLEHTLDHWRARIDELKVQGNLATLDIREDLAKRLEVTENVYLAVRSRLSDARHDSGSGMAGVHRSVDQLLADLRRSYDDAEAVVKRSHEA